MIFVLAAAAIASGSAGAQAPVARDADYHNRQMLYLYRLGAAEGWRTTASGLRYRKVAGPDGGQHPLPTDSVTIRYSGRFIDGTAFDSSGDEAPTFPLPRLIRGWQEGVPLMAVGDRFEFAIPASLAYGVQGRGPIPGGATLLFTIELLGIAPR
jgi:FKBP-type peptidyl-prolyl cis-trans isomerase